MEVVLDSNRYLNLWKLFFGFAKRRRCMWRELPPKNRRDHPWASELLFRPRNNTNGFDGSLGKHAKAYLS